MNNFRIMMLAETPDADKADSTKQADLQITD
jgi:hypothetical protein